MLFLLTFFPRITTSVKHLIEKNSIQKILYLLPRVIMSEAAPHQFPSTTDLPPHWEQKTDPAGRTYYANHEARTTSWKNPVTDEAEIEVKEDAEGRKYFIDHGRKTTSYLDPRLQKKIEGTEGEIENLEGESLSRNEEGQIVLEQETRDGRKYAVNYSTGKSSTPE